MSSRKEGELHIHNSDGQQQATILSDDTAGFVFESNRGTRHTFIAETTLGPEFSAGWTGKRGRKLQSKLEALKQKVGFVLYKSMVTWNFQKQGITVVHQGLKNIREVLRISYASAFRFNDS